LLGAVGAAGTDRDTNCDGRPLFARATANLVARGVGDTPLCGGVRKAVRVGARDVGVACRRVVPCDVDRAVVVAGYDTAVRAEGAGVLVTEKPAGTGVLVTEKPADTGVTASVDAAGVGMTVGTGGAVAFAGSAVPAAPPTTPPLPLTTNVATACAVAAPDLIVVTVVVAIGPLAKRVADVIVPAAPPEVTMAEARAPFAGAVALPVAPDRVLNTGMAVGVPTAAPPTVPTALAPLPPTLPCLTARPVAGVAARPVAGVAARPVAGVAVGWDDAAEDRDAAARVAAEKGVRDA